MKTIATLLLLLLGGITCYAQEIEFNGSLNTSSERRFQNAYGIGVQYQQNFSQKYKLGFGLHYNINSIKFDNIPTLDANPNLLIAQKINSDSKRFSILLNLQRMLMENDYASISLGPEFSYNYLWGTNKVDSWTEQSPTVTHYDQQNSLTKALGVGLISKVEVKNIITPKLSLCFTIRTEVISNCVFPKGGSSAFSGGITFTEFQLGFKYRL